ncbi:hypothetical protein V6N11_061776 [Hibiscus sabdariffa]|uniref:Uncharacterized protein n=2 Tax=Hibiscus sabdariffa TaxID=183260 RepID=A0ABR1ZQK3_9ROSI
MASILSSQAMVFATAMAVSGTVILLAFRLQKSFPLDQIHNPPPQQVLRSCISSGTFACFICSCFSLPDKLFELKSLTLDYFLFLLKEGRTKNTKKKKKKKKVQFAEDVMDRGELRLGNDSSSSKLNKFGGRNGGEMPANRVALYNGILRDRGVQRLAYSH